MDIQTDSERIVVMSDYEILRTKDLNLKEISAMKEKAALNILPNGFQNAQLIKEIQSKERKISTGCPVINEYLNGGLDRRCITEIYGESGCGKTQFGLQIAANCWNSGAVYLCTEDIFPSKRLQQLFEHIDSKNINSDKDLSKYGKNIFILQIIETEDLIKCVNTQLPSLLESKKSIEVIILDSIAAPFRGSYNDNVESNIQRAQHLRDVGMGLLKCAKQYNLAILCINQVSSVPFQDSINGPSLIPCLGLVWSNIVNIRIQVRKTNRYYETKNKISLHKQSDPNDLNDTLSRLNIREFQVIFSSSIPSDKILDYVIETEGIKIINR